MLSKELNEKLNIWTNKLNDIKEKINNLNEDKIKANANIQAALKEKNTDEIISNKQAIARIEEELEALMLIEKEIKKNHPVDPETFWKEYTVFKTQQRNILNKEYETILKKLSELEDSYLAYEGTYNYQVCRHEAWKRLAKEIGINLPLGLRNDIPAHRGLRNDLNRIIRISKGGTI